MKKLNRRRVKWIVMAMAVIVTLAFSTIQFSLSSDNQLKRDLITKSNWLSAVEKGIKHLVEKSNKLFTSIPVQQQPIDNFRSIIDHPDVCRKAKIILIGVMSAPQNEKQRKSIRSTWAISLSRSSNIQVLFFIGRAADNATQKQIFIENQQFSDIIQKDFIDSYANLTTKTIVFMHWIKERCSSPPSLIFKCDDDVFVHLPLMLSISLKYINLPKTMFGWLVTNSTPIYNPFHKFYVPHRLYDRAFYPPYLAGPLYAMTGDCVDDLYTRTLTIPKIPMEDVYLTGICAQDAKLNLVKENLMDTNPRDLWPSCEFLNQALRHECSSRAMKRMWIHFQDPCPTGILDFIQHWFLVLVETINVTF